jgi:hypothetical protein
VKLSVELIVFRFSCVPKICIRHKPTVLLADDVFSLVLSIDHNAGGYLDAKLFKG